MADKKVEEVTVIPPSQRPDGTWRKEIRVKAGYTPPDEAERYQSRGKQWASKASNLPPGMMQNQQKEEVQETKKSKNQKKNERKKQKKKEEATLKDDREDSATSSLSSGVKNLEINHDVGKPNEVQVSKEVLEKKIKGLKKKLRQIEELENKLSSGQVKELTKEQSEKVARKKAFSDELEDLELDLKLCE